MQLDCESLISLGVGPYTQLTMQLYTGQSLLLAHAVELGSLTANGAHINHIVRHVLQLYKS